jgi:hypothetical protein
MPDWLGPYALNRQQLAQERNPRKDSGTAEVHSRWDELKPAGSPPIGPFTPRSDNVVYLGSLAVAMAAVAMRPMLVRAAGSVRAQARFAQVSLRQFGKWGYNSSFAVPGSLSSASGICRPSDLRSSAPSAGLCRAPLCGPATLPRARYVLQIA